MMHTYKSEYRILPHRIKALLIVIIFALQTACATQFQKPIPEIPNQDTLGKVAVVTTADAPVIDVEGISQLKGAGMGTVGGAAAGIAVCAPYVIATLIVTVMCPLCGSASLSGLGACAAVGATAGAVVGSTSGATAEEIEKMQGNAGTLSETFKARSIQQLLRDQIEANMLDRDANSVVVLAENLQVAPAGDDYSSHAAVRVDTVPKVKFTDASSIWAVAEKQQVTPARHTDSPLAAATAENDFSAGASRSWVSTENQRVAPARHTDSPLAAATADNDFSAGVSRSRVSTESQWVAPARKPDSPQVTPAVNHYSPLASAGADTVLEVAFIDVGYKGGRTTVLTMSASVRLIDASNGVELFSSSYSWQGRQLKTDELSSLGAEGILKEVQRGYQAMVTHIDENIFLLFPFPDRKVEFSQYIEPQSMYGLVPSSPRFTFHQYLVTPAVDSLQPTVAWQKFPRERDIKRVPEQMNRVKNVRYDLVIADEQNNFPGEIIYRREGLPENSHQLEITLSPDEHYYWTVRARFMLDGRQRLTEWSSTGISNFYKTIDVPNQYSFQFKTRKKKAEQE